MVKAEIVAADLAEFYVLLRAAQERAHGPDYCAHHGLIVDAAKEGCETYVELGTNQGCTLACALLAGFRWAFGVDISPGPFRAVEALFQADAKRCDQVVEVFGQDSRNPLGFPIDFLLIDSLHRPEHLRSELKVHGPFVRQQILAHDTTKYPELAVELERWSKDNGWTVAIRESRGHGHMLLKRQT